MKSNYLITYEHMLAVKKKIKHWNINNLTLGGWTRVHNKKGMILLANSSDFKPGIEDIEEDSSVTTLPQFLYRFEDAGLPHKYE